MIFRKSLDSGAVPRDWKTANVTPLFKKGSRHQVSNYRPVSLTSQICKVAESVLRDELVQHLDQNDLISKSNHSDQDAALVRHAVLILLLYKFDW